jgi:hypothetical protein
MGDVSPLKVQSQINLRPKAKSGALKESLQEVWSFLESAELRHDPLAKLIEIMRGVVRQSVVFYVTPCIVNGVQFRCIRWKRFNNYSTMRSKIVSHRPGAVNWDRVPYKRDGVTNPVVYIFDKPCHRVSMEV